MYVYTWGERRTHVCECLHVMCACIFRMYFNVCACMNVCMCACTYVCMHSLYCMNVRNKSWNVMQCSVMHVYV